MSEKPNHSQHSAQSRALQHAATQPGRSSHWDQGHAASPGPSHDGLRHHGDEDARGAAIDFAVNVRTHTPHEALAAALTAEITNLGAYPDSQRLERATYRIAEHLGVPADHVLLLGGVSEGFSLLGSIARRGIIVHPGFTEPEVALQQQGVPTHRLILRKPWGAAELRDAWQRFLDSHPEQPADTEEGADTGNAGVEWTWDAAPGAAEMRPEQHSGKPKAVGAHRDLLIIGNPTNPTGRAWDPTQLCDLLSAAPQRTILVIDEAFADVSPSVTSALHLAATRDDVLVFRSLTKTFALAGLRCGVCIGSPELLAQLRARRPHWPLGSMQLAAFEWVAEHVTADVYANIAHTAAEELDYLRDRLAEFGITPACPSAAPYMLFELPWEESRCRQAREYLRSQGIAVRRCDTFPGLGDLPARGKGKMCDPTGEEVQRRGDAGEKYWRLVARPRAQVDALAQALSRWLNEPGG